MWLETMKRRRFSGALCTCPIHTSSAEDMPLMADRLAPERRLGDDDDTEWMGNAWHLTILDPTDGA